MSIASLKFNLIAMLTGATTSKHLSYHLSNTLPQWKYSYFCSEPSVVQLAARDVGDGQSDFYGLVSVGSNKEASDDTFRRERPVKLGTIPTAQAKKIIARFNKFGSHNKLARPLIYGSPRNVKGVREGIKLEKRIYDDLPEGSVSWPKPLDEAEVLDGQVFNLDNREIFREFISLGNVAPEQRITLFMAGYSERSREELERKMSARCSTLLKRAQSAEAKDTILKRYANLRSEEALSSYKVRFPKGCA